jgi:Skp family chaperone for outer membrane proteins
VKRKLIAALGVLALGVVVYAAILPAQSGARPNPQTTPAAGAPEKKGDRIALLNLAHVLRNYEKFKNYQEEMKKAVDPYQKKDQDIQKKGEAIAKQLQIKGITDAQKEKYEKDLTELKRELEDNKKEFQKNINKKQGQQLVILYSDIRTVAERYAQAHGFDIVLQFNDATEGSEYWSEANVARKMQTGPMLPLYYKAGMDISNDVLNNLNAAYRSGSIKH